MKFYRYVIYKLYNWALTKKSDTPIANVIITLTFVHFIQLFSIYLILLKLFPEINIFNKIDKKYIGLGLVIVGILHYFIIYNKESWNKYIEEFADEDGPRRKKGNILVIFYLVGSIVLFFLLLPLLYGL